MREAILTALRERGDLPPLPDIVIQLQRMIRDPSSNAREIARLLELEPVLAGRIIQLSNSVYYARSPETIKTLPVAITKIGFTTLMNLIYSLKVGTLFDGNRVLDGSLFWRHSMAVAFLTMTLCQRKGGKQQQQDVAYLAGLMHDVGIMVFGYLVPDEYRRFIRHARLSGEQLEVREREVFGIDHPELGALFTETWWQVDKTVVKAIRTHHQDTCEPGADPDGHGAPKKVYLANLLCNSQDITNGIECPHKSFDPDTTDWYELTGRDLDSILDDIRTSIAQAEELLAIKGS